MVIQSNMSPKGIIEVWEVFVKQSLETLLENHHLPLLLHELNFAVLWKLS